MRYTSLIRGARVIAEDIPVLIHDFLYCLALVQDLDAVPVLTGLLEHITLVSILVPVLHWRVKRLLDEPLDDRIVNRVREHVRNA